MAPKKKTVKELAGEMEVFDTRFKEMEKLFDKIKAIETVDKDNIALKIDKSNDTLDLENKVRELEKRLEVAESKISFYENSETTKRKENLVKCHLCESTFNDKGSLKKHHIAKHPKNLKCEHCEETFQLNWRLESHMKIHKQAKTFECDKCEKVFVLKWRLEKHQKIHDQTKTKHCHYFNNEKVCPYDDIGCMFRHETSSWCRFEKCSNKLCQFRHREENLQNENFKCSKCDKKFKNKDDLIIHEHEDHRNTLEVVINDDKIPDDQCKEIFPCISCSNIFATLDALDDHYAETAHDIDDDDEDIED